MKLFGDALIGIFLILTFTGVARAEIGTLSNDLVHEYLWVCTAHSEHDPNHNRLYRGQPHYDRNEAEHSALDECEYRERHACELAGCRRIRY